MMEDNNIPSKFIDPDIEKAKQGMPPLLGSQSLLDIINNSGRNREDNIDLNVGGKPQERFMLMRHDELPEFTEEEAGAIKNLSSNRKDKPGDKFGTVLLLGTGGDPSALHEAKKEFINFGARRWGKPGGMLFFPGLWERPKDAADYIVAYDPVKEGGFSMGICGTGRTFDMVVPSSNYQHMSVMGEWGIVIKPPSCFRKIEGPGTVLWKRKNNMAKNRLRKYITKSFYKRYKLI